MGPAIAVCNSLRMSSTLRKVSSVRIKYICELCTHGDVARATVASGARASRATRSCTGKATTKIADTTATRAEKTAERMIIVQKG